MFPEMIRASALACFLLVIAASAAAQTVQSAGKDQVSVHAEEARLGDLLRTLAEHGPVDRLMIEEDVEDARVTLSLEGTPFSEAMIAILQAASVDYVLQGGNGKPYQVYAGRGGSARRSVAPAAAGAGAGYADYEDPEPEDVEDEESILEISGDARLPVAPGSGAAAFTASCLAFGLLLGTLLFHRRSPSALPTPGGTTLSFYGPRAPH